MDATQTSEPTETGPASPGQASAFRRALDDQAANEGPLDLTVPLDIAEVRAALSNSGPSPVVPADAAPPADTAPSGPGSAPPPDPDHDGRRSNRHPGPKRLGRITVFVVLAATASLGTAYALVLSSGGQGSSVSLPATDGNIPVAPSGKPSGHGQLSAASGSKSAPGTPSLSHSPASTARTGAPSGGPDPSASPGRSTQPGTPSGQPTTTTPASGAPSNWVTLYVGIQNQSSEVSQVQSLLEQLGYLNARHHRGYTNPNVAVQPDADGTYGSATADAIASFQQARNLGSSPSGECDAATFEALSQASG